MSLRRTSFKYLPHAEFKCWELKSVYVIDNFPKEILAYFLYNEFLNPRRKKRCPSSLNSAVLTWDAPPSPPKGVY
jgi:hypothetical protein